MKNIFQLHFFVGIMLSTSLSVLGQTEIFCYNKPVPNASKLILNAAEHAKTNAFPSSLMIRIRFHIVRNKDGSGGRSEADILVALEKLNTAFNPHNICISYRGFDYIDNNAFYNIYLLDDPIFQDLVNTNNDPLSINVYVLGQNAPAAGGRANGFLFSSSVPNNNSIVLGGLINGDDIFLTQGLAHEVGHVLGLFHAFESTICLELVDGSNCSVCGDLLCDTKASQGLQLSLSMVDNACNYIGNDIDQNGDPYDPDPLNIMEYTLLRCMRYFTAGQGARMRSFLSTHSQLQPILVPKDLTIPTTTLTAGISRLYQVFNTITTNNLIINQGAELQLIAGDYVEIKLGFISEEGSISDIFVENNDCNSIEQVNAARQLLSINSSPNHIEHIDFQNDINGNVTTHCTVFPNPAKRSCVIQFPSSSNYSITLTTPTGQTIQATRVTSVQTQLSLEGLAPGYYYINVSSPALSETLKLAVLPE